MNRFATAITLFAMISSANAFANPARGAMEISYNNIETSQDQAQANDDRHDFNQLDRLMRRLDRAAATNNIPVIHSVDKDLRYLLARELTEARNEIAAARAELARSGSEVRTERREVAYNNANGATPGARVDDRQDLRDDKRDRIDDRNDLAFKEQMQARRVALANELNVLYGRVDPRSVSRKRAILNDLKQLALVEMQQNAREYHEDQAERREDRREAREVY